MQFDDFLKTFVYYCCSRCYPNAPNHKHQPVVDGCHHHNGTILGHIQEPFDFSRLWSAWQVYQTKPVNCELELATAYNNPSKIKKLNTLGRSVKYLYDNWDQTWLRHGLEHPARHEYGKGTLYPPHKSRQRVGVATRSDPAYEQGWYAVELETAPFDNCANHGLGCDEPWIYVAAHLPLQHYTGNLHTSGDRDHYYADTTVLEDKWLYIHRPIQTKDAQKHHIQKLALGALLKTDLMILEYNTVILLHTLRKHLRQQYSVYDKIYKDVQ